MGTKAPRIPDDPDPSPVPASESNTDVQSASRQQKKKAVQNYGRHQTILAGNTAQDNAGKKTILGS